MKQVLSFNPVFTPGGPNTGTLDFTSMNLFEPRRLYAVINVTRNQTIYGPAVGSTIGNSGITGTIITLSTDTSSMSSSDVLSCIYDYERSPVTVRNTRTALKEEGNSYIPNASWTETLKTGSGLIFQDGNSVGAGYIVLSLDPIDVTSATTIEIPLSSNAPVEIFAGISMSQRTLGQTFAFELVSTATDQSTPADLQIANIQQATTTLSITSVSAHNLRVGDVIGIRDVTQDSRLNYSAIVVATTPTITSFTTTGGPMGAFGSISTGPFSSGFVYRRIPLNNNLNGASFVFENATATQASLYVRGGESSPLPSANTGSFNVNQSVTINTTASIQAVNAALNYNFQPTTEYRLIFEPYRVGFLDIGADSSSTINTRLLRTQVIPDPTLNYRLRIRGFNHASLSRPNAQIVTVSKSGTTTATISTDVAHTFTTGDLVNAYGPRDFGNFANITTATSVTSVINPTQFTIVWGTAVTATSYGGFVSRANGQQDIQGVATMQVQNATRTSNIVTLSGSATWSGPIIGDTVNVIGVRDIVNGSTLGIDGIYRVRDIQTANLFLEPLSAPTGIDIATTSCGGSVIKRTDLRLHHARVFEYDREKIEFSHRGVGDASASMPVVVNSINAGQTISTITTVTTLAAMTLGNLGFPGIIADAASGAITSSATTTAVTPTYGTAYEVNVPVTAVTGTKPTLDFGIEESDDSGTNWYRVYDFPRITATGIYRSPKISLTGNRIRYVQTVGGTTPSFTRSINRLQASDSPAYVRQVIDRVISLTTLNAATSTLNIQNCRNAQLVFNTASATAVPAIQLEGSEDNGATWYSIGTALTSITATTVQSTVNNIQSQLLRGRVSTAGTGVSAGYVLIKGF